MPRVPDFRLYHGNDLDVLAGVLAAELAKPLAGQSLLAPDTILIPQPAMRRWLQKTLAAAFGVAANLRFLTPGEFVAEALAANLAGDDRTIADAATLRWRLWAVLADAAAMAAPVFAPLQPVLAGPDRALSAWALAGEVAAAFEKYQAWRRGWLLRWDAGADRDDWQAELWRRATAGFDHRARRLHAYLQQHDGEDPRPPRGLPPRVFAFACQNVSPDVLRVIASVARAGELHFFFVSPVRGWWGDLPSARARLRADADGTFAADRDNPLLIANGAAGRDFVDLLFAGEAVHPSGEVAAYADRTGGAGAPSPTLLHELQQALLGREAPPPAPTRAFDPGDRSLQLHACHTPLREVQVLHDQLRTLLEEDPTLQPRDIAVLTPDIDAYAPLVHAVFGGATAAGQRAIPYAVADGSTLAAQPLAAWWLQVLGLPSSRFTLADGLALLAPAAVRARLGLDAAAFAQLTELLRDAGVRWARDAGHREAMDAPADAEFTWRWAMDRLLLGHAGGDDAPVAGIAPRAGLDGGGLAAFDALLAGWRTCERLAREFARPRPAADWPKLLAGALAELLPERADGDDRQAIDGLRAHVGVLADEWRAAQVAGDVPIEVIAAWFRARLGEPTTRQPFLSGGVTFGRMVPMRLIPFRVICLLGMNDGDYPRRDPGGALNRLVAELGTPRRQPGDRSVREDDRFLFLQLFAAAGDVFYVSWLGGDPRSGETIAPSVVVSELVDVAARYRVAGAGTGAGAVTPRLVVRHPLHPFAPQAFGAPWPGEPAADAERRRPWHGAWRAAAEGGGVAKRPLPPFVPVAPPARATDATALSVAQLVAALANPPRHFLQQRLALRLPHADDPLPDSEPLAHDDGLHRYALAQRVFAALRAADIDADTLRRRLLAEGLLPPGPAGAELLREAQALAAGAAAAARAWSADAPTIRPWRLALAGGELHGQFVEHAAGLLQFRPGKAHGRAQLGFGIEHLAWHALGDPRPVRRLLPGEAPRDLPVLAADVAAARLAELVAIARDAAADALPLLPKAGFDWFELAANDPVAADAAAASAWLGDHHRPGESDDPWVQLALRGRDPFADGDDAQRARFRALATRMFTALAGLEPADG